MATFKIDEGMTIEGSTIEQRKEIWRMLFDLNLIAYQCESIEDELEYLEFSSFYNDPIANSFLADKTKEIPIINIPFEKFKERLLKLKSE